MPPPPANWPHHAHPYPQPPVKPLRSLTGLSYALVTLLGLIAVIDAAGIYAALNIRSVIDGMTAGDPTEFAEVADRADMLMFTTSALYVIGFLATATVFIIWFHRARTNAEVFAPGTLRRGSGWAIGSWFIPFANLWIPRGIAGDIWSASELDERRPQTVLNAWWTVWVLDAVISRITDKVWQKAEEPEAIHQAAMGLVFSDLLNLVAAILAILFVRRLTAMQETKALAGPRPTPVMATS